LQKEKTIYFININVRTLCVFFENYKKIMGQKRVYLFGNGKAEGNAKMREELGGKGANLAEMNLIGVPVPPGFTITTDCCNEYYEVGQQKIMELLNDEVTAAVQHIETLMNSKFGDVENPLLVSVRSGARASMPGMMDTILNLGLNDEVAEGMVRKTNNPHFVYDSYRRFVQMYGDVVLELKPANKEDIDPFEEIIEKVKKESGVELDKDLSVDDLKKLVKLFKAAIKERTGKDFPDDPIEQLWGAICAVFRSWMNERAILYRKMEGIPDEWGTAVSVMAMVFGNMGDTSATGVCFSRDAGNGENLFNGEYLVNAQGEDVVAGIRTPQQITKIGSQRWAKRAGISEEERVAKYPSMEEAMPEIYKELDEIQTKLENHYHDMQDMEFTVQEGKLWFLQTRNGKRTGTAMVKIAMDLLHEGMIDEKTAILRCEPQKLDELLHPVFDKLALQNAKVITQGLPASPGAACGQIVFHADDAQAWHADGHKVVMVRIETSPEDLAGMASAEGILTARGGMTSHAAVVARGMGKCCVSGAGAINVDYKTKTVEIDGTVYHEGDYISLNGSTGQVYAGEVPTKAAELSGDFKELMDLCDKYTKLQVRTNADTPHDAQVARAFGAKGIGLTRTEHMFFEDKKIIAMREMILSDNAEGREKALAKLLPYQKADFKGILEAMDGCPVNIRLLDPPLHEFVPHDLAGQETMAKEMGVDVKTIQKRVASLAENNPMLGHRGCRLGITFPEITAMQTRAILSAACELKKEGKNPMPEIMVPLIGILYELKQQKEIIQKTAKEVFEEYGIEIKFEIGTMIEIPRAALTADRIATEAEYFSFGTNDLTQMTFGYSRDDIASFLPVYLEKKILKVDPFQVLDQNGVGKLIKYAVRKGREVRPDLRCGICGEHGGEPSSVKFCAKIGMNYASCSPFRVPIARLAAAQAAVEE
jgi:pyruvate,orthophosphate dikinase